jgi:hypothetical protein
MSTSSTSRYADCLSASWLSARLGLDTSRIEVMRRAGELIAFRPEGSTEWLYPAWQFRGGRPRPSVPRITAAARQAGLDERRLYEVLTMRLGLGGDRRLCDLLASGEDERVVAAVRQSA